MTVNDLPTFKFWCYKVLPLVYDDSLSYYEVLCKCAWYINKLIDSDKELANQIGMNINDIKELRKELKIVQTWIANYDTTYAKEILDEVFALLSKDKSLTSLTVAPQNRSIYLNKIGLATLREGFVCGGATFIPETNQLAIGVHLPDDTSSEIQLYDVTYNDPTAPLDKKKITGITYNKTISLGTRTSHLNSLCYNDGKIYCFDWNQNANNGIYNSVTIINVNTGEIKATKIPTNSSCANFYIYDTNYFGFRHKAMLATLDHTSRIGLWLETSDGYLPWLILPIQSQGNSYTQDISASQTAIYTLYTKSQGNSNNLISVATIAGGTTLNYYIVNVTEELEGLVKLIGSQEVILIGRSGNVYTGELGYIGYNSILNEQNQMIATFRKNHCFYWNPADSKIGYTEYNLPNGSIPNTLKFSVPNLWYNSIDIQAMSGDAKFVLKLPRLDNDLSRIRFSIPNGKYLVIYELRYKYSTTNMNFSITLVLENSVVSTINLLTGDTTRHLLSQINTESGDDINAIQGFHLLQDNTFYQERLTPANISDF